MRFESFQNIHKRSQVNFKQRFLPDPHRQSCSPACPPFKKASKTPSHRKDSPETRFHEEMNMIVSVEVYEL